MSTVTTAIPQPLSGMEIRKGIAVRMTQGLPLDVAEALREQIVTGLGKTCSLMPNAAYAKFKATWELAWWNYEGKLLSSWWVSGSLDDFGRITPFGIGRKMSVEGFQGYTEIKGTIDEVPPDRFRRETDQPIPKPTELRLPEPEKSTMSKSIRGQGKRRTV